MKHRLARLLAAGLVLAAGLPIAGARPLSDPGAPGAVLDSQRDIVLAVDNPLVPMPMRAGSTLLGYAAAKPYGASRQALETLETLKRRYRLREVAGWPIKPLGLFCVVLQPPPGAAREALLAALAADAGVQLVQPLQDFALYASDPPEPARPEPSTRYNDPYIDLQRGFIATDAADAQTRTQGRGVQVALVDTGVDSAHPDLHGRIRAIHDLVDAAATGAGGEAHGTEVAGIIAANSNNRLGIAGMAPKAVLDVYKACWYPAQAQAGARCNSFTLAKALAAISDSDARVVNLSLGGPADPLLQRLLEQLLQQRRIVVAALPPDGRLDGFPIDIPGVIAVRSGHAAGTAASGVLDAPGEDILTTQPGGGYDFSSGSSMAAAHVSGLVALLLSLTPDLDAHDARALLLKTRRTREGSLQVNAEAAVEALTAGAGKPPAPTALP